MSLLWICLLIISTNVDAWDLPPAQFLSDFAKFHDRASVMIYLPDNIPQKWIKWHQEGFSRVNQEQLLPIAYITPAKPFSNLSMVQKSDSDLHVFIIDDCDELRKNESMAQFFQTYGLRTRASREYWLLDVGSWTNAPEALEAFEDLVVDVDDDLYWYAQNSSKNSSQITVDIWEIYRKHQDFPLSIVPSGNWSQLMGTNMASDEKWIRRKDLSGVTFRVATLPSIPYITQMIPIEGKEGYFTMEGMFAEVFFSLQDIMNFSFTLQKPPDSAWGALQLNGSWTGMVRQLQEDMVDIAATDFTVTMARSEVITFAEPITQIHHRLFIKNPAGTFNYQAYTEPLHFLAWVGILLYCLLAPPFLFWTSQYGERDPKYFEFTLKKCMVFAVSTILQRGWSDTPTTAASRTAFFSMVVASTILFWHWEAMLISYLSTRVIILPFDGVTSLIDSSDFKIALIPDSSYQDAFKYSTDPNWQNAWKTRIEPNLEDYRAHGSNMVHFPLEDSTIALYDNYFSISAFDEYTTCKLISIPSKYDFKPYAYGFQKDSPYLGMFNFYLKEMREKGSLQQILKKYEAAPQVCPDLSGLPLGFDSCFTAFLALIGGMICALVMVLIELISRWSGWNWHFLQAYDRRCKNNIIDSNDQSRLIIQRLTLQNWRLEQKVAELEKLQSNGR